jgi:hypothetical protein
LDWFFAATGMSTWAAKPILMGTIRDTCERVQLRFRSQAIQIGVNQSNAFVR